MSLQDLLNAGVDVGNRSAVDAALNTDQAVEAAAEVNERIVPEPVNADPGDETDEAAEGEVAPEPAAELEAPVPTGEQAPAATPDPRIAELEAELATLRTAAATTTAVQEKSAAAQERATLLAELVDTLGEDHPIVKVQKRAFADADKAEQAQAEQAETSTNVQNQASHATHITTTPFLKSFYDAKDDEGIEIAAAISNRIMQDPKLAGTKAATPFTAEHYREVEARLLARFPEAKAKFYKAAAPAKGGKVVPITHAALRGGSSPAATPRKTVGREDIFAAALSNPNTDLDQLLNNLHAG